VASVTEATVSTSDAQERYPAMYPARPRLLDLFCGAGGAAMGYHRAGFEVVGVDLNRQPHYPFEFHQADAMTFPLDGFDAIHASPPCQDHMRTPHAKHGTGWMLPQTRERLAASGASWVIENVASAPMRADFVLCGCQFGLRTLSGMGLRRERWFETSWGGFALRPGHDHREPAISVVGHGTPSWVRAKLGRNPTIAEYRESMGIDWMNRDELSQAIPPAYTEWIGRQLLAHLEQRAAA
jgi:DNA (cytosine-5)-methyltransferase 1